ncbi:hypothetical protein [Geopsychrobacter electrodiphilus]|nr:hypothetical protein [Geopsychrobacter electrodiphilus]
MIKTITTLALIILLVSALSACAPFKKSPTRVKCPACGYEFDVPQS